MTLEGKERIAIATKLDCRVDQFLVGGELGARISAQIRFLLLRNYSPNFPHQLSRRTKADIAFNNIIDLTLYSVRNLLQFLGYGPSHRPD